MNKNIEVIYKDKTKDIYRDVTEHGTCDGGMHITYHDDGVKKQCCIPYEDIGKWYIID